MWIRKVVNLFLFDYFFFGERGKKVSWDENLMVYVWSFDFFFYILFLGIYNVYIKFFGM